MNHNHFIDNRIKKKKNVQISCSKLKLGFENFAIVSCYKDIRKLVRCFQSQSLTKLELFSTQAYNRLSNYTIEEVEYNFHCQEKSNYRVWCSNVLMYYIVQYILHNESIPIIPQFCHNCKKKDKEYTFKKCSRCKIYYYCSKKCQIDDWNHHKHYCKI
jgi:hypothetical protein